MATQAKSNIAVSNDAISGVYTPNGIITIAGIDRSTAVRMKARITLNRNDEPDSAEFIVNRDGGFVPTAGQAVGIALGDAENYVFAGQIGTVRHLRTRVADTPDYEVSCVDWSRLFNRRLITADFSGQSASDIATTIVEDYTSGFFTYAIEDGLASVNEFICINEPPTSVLARLATFLGGGCYIDPYKIVHLWSDAGPSSYYAPSPPATLTNSLDTLKKFEPEYDYSQVRTRVIVEGASSPLPVEIPVGANLLTYGIPLVDEAGTHFSSIASTPDTYARIGAMVVAYDHMDINLGPPSVKTVTEALAGDGQIEVEGFGTFDQTNVGTWVHDGSGNYFVVAGFSTLTGPPVTYYLTGIPAAGNYGALTVEKLAAGIQLYQAHSLESVVPQTASGDVEVTVPNGDAVVVRVQHDDSAAQAVIAAIEGGDGIHEFLVSDGDLTYTGCSERADAELDVFGATLLRATWVTHDPQAVPGAQQVINLTSPDVISATLTIDSVSIDFLVDDTRMASLSAPVASNLWPRRNCRGSTVKLATILDAIRG